MDRLSWIRGVRPEKKKSNEGQYSSKGKNELGL